MRRVADCDERVGRPARSTIAALALLAAIGCAPLSALTSGSVPLTAVLGLAKPYPNLLLEIRLQLVAADVKREQVTCTGEQLGPEWVALAGGTRGPYSCRIGKRQLIVQTVPTYADKAGHRVKPGDPALPARAAKLVEKRLTWQWR